MRFVKNMNLVWVGLFLGVLFWFIESAIHYYLLDDTSIFYTLFHPCIHEIWMRLVVAFLFVVFGLYGQNIVAKRKRAEKRAQLIMENNPAAIVLVDCDSRTISYANKNALEIIGSRADEIVGSRWDSFFCAEADDKSPVMDSGRRIVASESEFYTRRGQQIPILKSVIKIDCLGSAHLLVAFFNIAEQKEMQRAVELAHAELDQIFQTASVGMRVIDVNYKVLKINKTFEKMTGVAEIEAIGKKCSDIFGGSMCFTDNCPLELILKGHEWIECYVEKRNPEGVLIPCILSATPFNGPDNRIVGIIESFQDISALKNASEVIELERDKLDRILAHISEGICIINSEYEIEYQNPSFREIVGNRENLPCYRCLRDATDPCDPCSMHQAIKSGKIECNEYETRQRRIFEQIYLPILEINEQSKVVVLLRDVTEKKARTEDLMRSEKLAALGEMAASVAHEINNPINGIINYAQILGNKKAGDMLTVDISHRVIKEGKRIARIVEGLLTFAQRRKNEKTPFSLEEVIADAISLTSAQMHKDNILLQTEIEPGLPPVIGIPFEIEQVFINIITNAINALNLKHPGSHEMKRLRITASRINCNGRSHACIAFHDQGTGIPRRIIDKVRNPFFTTKNNGKHTGLGLSISHGIVKEHRGQLKIESVEGEFTCVRIELPLDLKREGAIQ